MAYDHLRALLSSGEWEFVDEIDLPYGEAITPEVIEAKYDVEPGEYLLINAKYSEIMAQNGKEVMPMIIANPVYFNGNEPPYWQLVEGTVNLNNPRVSSEPKSTMKSHENTGNQENDGEKSDESGDDDENEKSDKAEETDDVKGLDE